MKWGLDASMGPTVMYNLEYHRSDTVSWSHVAEKLVAMIGAIFFMIQVFQYSICEQLREGYYSLAPMHAIGTDALRQILLSLRQSE